MKVVFCAYDGQNIINGINTWLIRLLPQLVANSIQVSVIFITWAPEENCTTIPLLRAKGIKCTVIPGPQYTETQVKWILAYLKAENPDVFVPGNMIPALYASKRVKQASIATVAVLHNDDEEHDALSSEFISKHPADYLSAVVAVSAILYQKVSGDSNTIKVYQIPCGAPVPEQKTGLNTSEPFKVVYIGRIAIVQKRIDDIARSFCKCANLLPQTDFLIYGSGPDVGLVNNTLQAHGSPKNVYFKGSIQPDEVQAVLLTSQAIVLMSDYEGVPVALMEAMACGVVPVCKSISSGIPELVTDGVTGLLMNNPDELFEKINYLQQHNDKWNELSVNCKKLVTDYFSSQKNVNDWVSLFNEVAVPNKGTINIAASIKLPPTHPRFGDLDRREPATVVKAMRKIKRIFNN